MKWIAIKDQKPPCDVQIIAYGKACGEMVGGADICIRRGPPEDFWDWWNEGGTECANDYDWTHWMPLPEPPTKENDHGR